MVWTTTPTSRIKIVTPKFKLDFLVIGKITKEEKIQIIKKLTTDTIKEENDISENDLLKILENENYQVSIGTFEKYIKSIDKLIF